MSDSSDNLSTLSSAGEEEKITSYPKPGKYLGTFMFKLWFIPT